MKASSLTSLALRTSHLLRHSSNKIRSNLYQLSTSADDRADAFSVNLRTQISKTSERIKVANQAQGFLSVVDSTLHQQSEILLRLKELAVAATNSALSATDRKNLQSETASLVQELNEIAKSSLSPSSYSLSHDFNVHWALSDHTELALDMSSSLASDLFKLEIGNGSFNATSTISSSHSSEIQSGDFDLDGDNDLIIVNGSSDIEIHLNQGDGQFYKVQTIAGSYGEVALADINQDGVLDFAITAGAGDTEIYLGTGDGRFTFNQTLEDVYDAQIGDIDGDGINEIIGADGTATYDILVYQWNGGNLELSDAFSDADAFSLPQDIEVADFNGDGTLDIFYTTVGNFTSFLHLNQGDGSFAAPLEEPSLAIDGYNGSFADFNEDGFLDIALPTIGGSVIIGLGSASGSFDVYSVPVNYSGVLNVQTGDINRDGHIDIVIGGETIEGDQLVSVLIGNGQGQFVANQGQILSSNLFGNMRLGDFDGDSILDLIYADSASTQFFQGLSKMETRLSDSLLATPDQAQRFQEVISNAMESVLLARSQIANAQNQLSSRSEYLSAMEEQYRSAQDLQAPDTSLLISELVASQIQQQAQIAVLAQANVQRQIILGLLEA